MGEKVVVVALSGVKDSTALALKFIRNRSRSLSNRVSIYLNADWEQYYRIMFPRLTAIEEVKKVKRLAAKMCRGLIETT